MLEESFVLNIGAVIDFREVPWSMGVASVNFLAPPPQNMTIRRLGAVQAKFFGWWLEGSGHPLDNLIMAV